MGKRFIDTSIFNKGWRKVPPTLKLSFFYFWINCDKAGVWEIDEDLFEFDLGINYPSTQDFQKLKDLGLIEMNDKIILLSDFSLIDNGKLGISNAHKPAQRSIEKYNLYYNPSTFKVSLTNLNPTLNQPSLKVVEREREREREREGIKGGVGEISTFNFSNTELFKSVCSFFSISELRNPQDLMNLNSFLNVLKKKGQFDEFENQFPAYVQYKQNSKQPIHAFRNFIGYGLTDGDAAWTLRDWRKEVEQLETKESGKVIEKQSFRELVKEV